jgi:type IV pilus assembly protein PilA
MLIVLGIIMVILAIAIPNMLRAKMLANETAAIGAIRTLNVGETQFLAQRIKYAASLSELAAEIPDTLHGGIKDGYKFELEDDKGGYIIRATPLNFSTSGRRNFYSDQSLVIRENWGTAAASASSRAVGN